MSAEVSRHWIYGVSIPAFVIGLGVYGLRIMRTRKARFKISTSDFVVWMVFVLALLNFGQRIRLARLHVASYDDVDFESDLARFSKQLFHLLVLESFEEILGKSSVVLIWLDFAKALGNRAYLKLVTALGILQLVYAFRLIPFAFTCRPLNLVWRSHYLEGSKMGAACFDRGQFLLAQQAMLIATDVLVLVTPAIGIVLLPPRLRKPVCAVLVFLLCASFSTIALGTYSIHKLINVVDVRTAHVDLLRAYCWGLLRAPLYLFIPNLGHAWHTIADHRDAIRRKRTAASAVFTQTQDLTLPEAEAEAEETTSAGEIIVTENNFGGGSSVLGGSPECKQYMLETNEERKVESPLPDIPAMQSVESPVLGTLQDYGPGQTFETAQFGESTTCEAVRYDAAPIHHTDLYVEQTTDSAVFMQDSCIVWYVPNADHDQDRLDGRRCIYDEGSIHSVSASEQSFVDAQK